MGLGRVGLVDDDLGDPVPVAQVEEDQLPWSRRRWTQPASRASVPGVRGAELAGGVRAVGRGEAGVGSVMAGVW